MNKENYLVPQILRGAQAANNPGNIGYNTSSYEEYICETFLKEKFEDNTPVLNWVDESIWIRGEPFKDFLEEMVKEEGFVITPAHNLLLVNDEALVVLKTDGLEVNKITIYTQDESYATVLLNIAKEYQETADRLSINWVYSSNGASMTLTEEMREQVTQDLYPFIENFDTFAERFYASNSNILILQGDPGTGKTTFIKHLMSASGKQAYVTYDASILSSDHIFANYMEDDDAGSFVIEDADLFLKSRADGNGMVARFLNIGDGIIKMKEKKLIFSTNLPNVKDIDPALLRPGRCFQVINFRHLTAEEAGIIAKNRGLVLSEAKEKYTLAEVFNSPVKVDATTKRSMGFC